jgi:hypothetical protein
MRTLFLSAAFLAAAGLAALTPGSASAERWGYHTPRYYQGYSYYPPSYGYGVPTVSSYATNANVYIDPTGQVFSQSAGVYYQNVPVAPAFVPVYSGPRYYQGYAPPRLLVYPR